MTLICLEYFSAHIFMAIWFTLTVTVTSSLVTFSGIVMLCNDSHNNKAPFPMLVTLSGIIMLSNKTHHLKASHPTLVTPFGIVMFSKAVHLAKALSPMLITQFSFIYVFILTRQINQKQDIRYKF